MEKLYSTDDFLNDIKDNTISNIISHICGKLTENASRIFVLKLKGWMKVKNKDSNRKAIFIKKCLYFPNQHPNIKYFLSSGCKEVQRQFIETTVKNRIVDLLGIRQNCFASLIVQSCY